MSLRIQIPVTDFDGMMEIEMGHVVIIPFDTKSPDRFPKLIRFMYPF